MLHKQYSFDLKQLFDQKLDIPRKEIPDGVVTGDHCLFNVDDSLNNKWTHGRVVYRDFNLEKYNDMNNTECATKKFRSKYYLFTPFKGKQDEVTDALRSLFDFASDYQITVKGGLIILPDEQIESDEELKLDIFLPVTSQIPKKLLKVYLPYRIRRKNYNFYTY